jgi:hypothetical protein
VEALCKGYDYDTWVIESTISSLEKYLFHGFGDAPAVSVVGSTDEVD